MENKPTKIPKEFFEVDSTYPFPPPRIKGLKPGEAVSFVTEGVSIEEYLEKTPD